MASMVVAGAYFYARYRVRNALKEIPGKIGIEIQQSAQGFTISKSEAGRTLFKVQASKVIQFKQSGRAELHDVTIVLYGRDASRFDQIYGSDFEYDPKSGEVSAKGEVQIDLEANPAGLNSADQSPPPVLKNPIHLRTSGLIFNQKTGNAYTKDKIELSIPQASGSAVGASYSGQTNVLTLESQLHFVVNGTSPGTVEAVRGIISKTPRQVVLQSPRLTQGTEVLTADEATLALNDQNAVEKARASGNVQAMSQGGSPMQVRANQLELVVGGPKSDILRSAVLTGDVRAEDGATPPSQAEAGRVVMTFAGKNVLSRVHADDGVKLLRHDQAKGDNATAQDVTIHAPAMDFFLVKGGRTLDRAETIGGGLISIVPVGTNPSPRTVASAGKFVARFDAQGRLSGVHGEPEARITSSSPGQPDRVSTSDTLDVGFQSGGGIASLAQAGHLAYVDGERKAWAERARYTPADQTLVLSGSPRVVEGGMTTTARVMRLNRTSGDATAEDNVKSTYSDLKPQSGGALLASSSPIHVTAQRMTAHRSPAVAIYTGNARLWQDSNVVQAPVIEFDRDHRSLLATAGAAESVSTILVQTDKSGKATPVTATAARLTYTDSERKAHYDGGVVVRGLDSTITSQQMDILLAARGPNDGKALLSGPSQLDRIVAQGNVVITQPQRQATGEQLVYTAAEDKFVLSGGTPSIFDAEHGKITGVSLTFYRHDDRVQVEGRDSSPTVTQTRVAR